MIHNIFIIKADGTSLLSKQYGSIDVDENLITGFITAINTFAEQIIQRQVDEIVMGDLKFIYSRSRELDVIYAICASTDLPADTVKNFFDQVDQQFIKHHEDLFNDDSIKDIAKFNEFIPALDDLVQDLGAGEARDDGSIIDALKKLIRLSSVTKESALKSPLKETRDTSPSTSTEITQPKGDLNQVYAINKDAIPNVNDIPTEDLTQKMALHYLDGNNTVEDIILSLQLLGYNITSPEKLLDFFKECEAAGYLKLISD